ncbi:hypothetical protein QVD17_20531 [Tagetes erecta]|uniref:Transposase (putative) gypsy type domain-containing protein n=1 Tax=Tagetes erecta TaxID=13708 RepID=A0AAD8KT05_TARER|nr:hypothetical protein QVD17_20531 [Tagetes erecta]
MNLAVKGWLDLLSGQNGGGSGSCSGDSVHPLPFPVPDETQSPESPYTIPTRSRILNGEVNLNSLVTKPPFQIIPSFSPLSSHFIFKTLFIIISSIISLTMTKHMSLHLSKLDHLSLQQLCLKYSITPKYKPTLPHPDQLITDCPHGYIALYTKHFDFSNLRIPFSSFFLSFLKAYRLNISQLSPFGAIKVTHFEIACRAFGGEPSLPLFRQFYVLRRYCDWYPIEKRKTGGPSCVSMVPKSLINWKDYFFLVSADVIPFEMQWREDHEPLNVIDPRSEHFDEKLFRMLADHHMPLQPVPEHVLIMTGLSRNWMEEDAEPILVDGDDEIDLVKYIQKKDLGDVKLTSRVLGEHEVNILDRTRGICYEGPQSEIQGDGNTGGGDVENAPENMTGGSLQPVRMLDLLLGPKIRLEPSVVPGQDDKPEVWEENRSEIVSEGQKRHRLDESASSSKKQKIFTVKNVVVSSDKSASPETVDAEQQPGISSEKVVSLELDGSCDEVDQKSLVESDVHLLDLVRCFAQLVGSVPELVTRYQRKAKSEARLREHIAKLEKKVETLKSLNKSTLDKNMENHGKVVDALKTKLEEACDKNEVMQARHAAECGDLQDKLMQVNRELEVETEKAEKLKRVNKELELDREMAAREKDGWSQERVQLEKLLERVSFERKWLIEEGFEYVINRLHRSEEFLKPLGDVQSKLWSSAAHDGVVAGYEHCKARVALKDAELYNPKAEEEFEKAVYELEHMKYPYVRALSQCAERRLDELKALEPMGMEDEVAASGD